MEEMEVYTYEQWGKDRMFKAKPGQIVDDRVFNQMLNCVPPLHYWHDYMQVGEPYGYDFDKHCTTYSTFIKEDGRWKFIGELGNGEGRSRLKDFNDLVFENRSLPGHKQAKMFFDNGYGVSVLCGTMFFSNGNDTYEVAVLKGNLIDFNHQVKGDAYGYRTKQEVSDIMARVQRM